MKTVATAPLLENSLLARQFALETEAVEEGRRRYHRLAQQAVERGEGAGLKPAERLLLHWFKPMVETIKEEQKRLADTLPQHQGTYAFLLSQIDAETAAVATMHETVSQCMLFPDGVVRTRLYYTIGNAIVGEINIANLKKRDPKQHEALMFSARKLTPKRVNRWARKKLDDADVGRVQVIAVGAWLFQALQGIASLDSYDREFKKAFKYDTHEEARKGGKWRAKIVLMEPEAFRIIDDGHAARSLMRPRYLPMLVPPYPWQEKGDVPGGYIRIRGPLTIEPTKDQSEALKGRDKSELFECLTALSGQGWRINRRILEVQQIGRAHV